MRPGAEVLCKNAELLALEGTGATRLVDRKFQDELPGPSILKRGGGAYYSFATRSHSYDSEPDVELQNSRLSSGFNGLSFGTIYDLGSVDLAQIDTSGANLPDGISKAAAEAWPILWTPIELESAKNRLQQKGPFWRHQEKASAVGSTYILRAWLHEEHDILVAFRIEAKGPYGITIVWRELKTFFQASERRHSTKDRHAEIEDAPVDSGFGAALRELSLEELLTKLSAEVECANVLEIPESEKKRYLEASGKTSLAPVREGFLRLFERGKAAGVLGDNVGCYYSFANAAHGWDRRSEIGFEQSHLNGGYHNCWAIDLGALSADAMSTAMDGTCPQSLEDGLQRSWEVLQEMTLSFNDRRKRVPSDDWSEEVSAAGILRSDISRRELAKVTKGHSYLLRTAGSQGDLLLVMTVNKKDAISAMLAWRLVERFDAPEGK